MKKEFEKEQKDNQIDDAFLDMPDMEDDEKFRQWLEEEYLKEADAIEEALFDGRKFEDNQDIVEKLSVSRENFYQRAREEGLLEDTADEKAEDTSSILARSSNLNYGNVKIQRVSSNEIAIYGFTQCHRKCSKVYLSLFLERKVNGSYGTYKIWEFTANNVTSLSKEIDVAVPSGTYYRVRGYHAASQSGTKESTSTLTSGIMVK